MAARVKYKTERVSKRFLMYKNANSTLLTDRMCKKGNSVESYETNVIYAKKEQTHDRKTTISNLNKRPVRSLSCDSNIYLSFFTRCKYENCNTEFVRNINECYCCTELEGCVEALQSDLVVQDLEPCTKLKSVTEHPGFAPVCLKKWSLRMAAKKLRRRDKETYKQTGTEERLLRALAYREFTRLIYGIMGRKIIPLPACAYHAIRRTFPMAEDDDGASFELGDD
ncbi:uncharacterized protein LOC125568312 [Nematostella vectensis]|uniref:uncharacterized protein LOC125568312 n=1 Tax=Nematostella vectensis TaxID=45351 RepID=UPI002076F0A2|nr:uncharacterized protein LOC125568312 [Nematostella vectensis]